MENGFLQTYFVQALTYLDRNQSVLGLFLFFFVNEIMLYISFCNLKSLFFRLFSYGIVRRPHY